MSRDPETSPRNVNVVTPVHLGPNILKTGADAI